MPIYFSKEEEELRNIKATALANQLDIIDEQVKMLKQSKQDLIKKMWFEYAVYIRLKRKYKL